MFSTTKETQPDRTTLHKKTVRAGISIKTKHYLLSVVDRKRNHFVEVRRFFSFHANDMANCIFHSLGNWPFEVKAHDICQGYVMLRLWPSMMDLQLCLPSTLFELLGSLASVTNVAVLVPGYWGKIR